MCWSVSMPFRGGHSRYGYPGDTIHHVTLFLPTYRDCTPHVPWRLWKVAESNRLLILRFLMSPPRGRTAVAFFGRWVSYSNLAGLHHCFRLFPSLSCVSLYHSGPITSAPSNHHTSHWQYSAQSHAEHRPNGSNEPPRQVPSPSPSVLAAHPRMSSTTSARTSGTAGTTPAR